MHEIMLNLTVSLESRWHAGAGEGSLTVDRNIRRDSSNRPYIPGSTLKGIIRENCERLCRTLGLGEPSDPHSSNIRDKAGFGPLEISSNPVDALFGNKFEGADLFVRNAVSETGNEAPVMELTRASISRARRIALHGHLFTSEYAMPAKFRTVIHGYHRNLVSEAGALPFAYSILLAAILNISRIGSDKSTGCGSAAIHIDQIRHNGMEIHLASALECIADNEFADFYDLCRSEMEGA